MARVKTRIGLASLLAVTQVFTACGPYQVSQTKVNQPSVSADPYEAEIQNDQSAALGGRPLSTKARKALLQEMFEESRTETDDDLVAEAETFAAKDESADLKNAVTSIYNKPDKTKTEAPEKIFSIFE